LADVILTAPNKQVITFGRHQLSRSLFAERDLRALWEARVAKNVKVDVLFPASDCAALREDLEYSDISNIRFNRRVQILPPQVESVVMYTVVDDIVLFWSNEGEDFFFQITNHSYAESLLSIFKFLIR
jgi:hypothetical protein